jgi:hypothetical protein
MASGCNASHGVSSDGLRDPYHACPWFQLGFRVVVLQEVWTNLMGHAFQDIWEISRGGTRGMYLEIMIEDV